MLECLAACPQLCSEERRALAEEMEPITTPLRNWLLNLEGGAPPLRGPRSSQPAAAAAPAAQTGARKGKGKGSNKKGAGGGATAGETAAGATQEQEVEGEFFSQGKRGEGNRRDACQSPELSEVVTHNLVVLLSALHRASPGLAVAEGAADGGGGGGASVVAAGATAAPPPAPTSPETGEGSAGAADDDDAAASSEGGDGDGSGAAAAAAAASRLLLAAVDAGGRLAREQELVFGLAEPLLDACMQEAARRASPQLFGTVVETKALLRRRLWSSEDPSALDRQQREADVELDAAVPSIKVRVRWLRSRECVRVGGARPCMYLAAFFAGSALFSRAVSFAAFLIFAGSENAPGGRSSRCMYLPNLAAVSPRHTTHSEHGDRYGP